MPILTDADLDRVSEGRRATLRDDLRKPELMRVGKIRADNTIEVYPDELGEVYVRRLGDGVGEAIPVLYNGEPMEPNAFVEVAPYRGRLRIVDYAPENAQRREGVPLRPQAPISISQFDYGLMRPTAPPSMTVVVTSALRNLNGTAHLTGNLPTKSFAGDVPVADAVAVMVELDPTDGSFTYTTSGSFGTDLSLAAAFTAHLPASIGSSRFLCGYVKLYAGQETITREDILPAPEVISKTGSDPFAKAIYAPGLGHLVTDVGELVITE